MFNNLLVLFLLVFFFFFAMHIYTCKCVILFLKLGYKHLLSFFPLFIQHYIVKMVLKIYL